MTHYTIEAAAQELGIHPLLLRLILITQGVKTDADTITERQLDDIRLTAYQMRRSEDDHAADC